MVVYKYHLTTASETELQMPVGAQVLRVDVQHESICLWALVDPDAQNERRVFEVFGTGHEMPNQNRIFINTFLVRGGSYVFHAFERMQ